MKGYLSTAMVAERLGINPSRVRQMVLSGIIRKSEKIGRDVFIPESEVARLEKTERKTGRPRRRAQ